MSTTPYEWRRLVDTGKFSQEISCPNTNGNKDTCIIIEGTKEEIFWEKSGKKTGTQYILDIRPLFVLKNCLPVTIHFSTTEKSDLDQETPNMSFIEPGQSGHLLDLKKGQTSLQLKIFEFRENDWTCSQLIEQEIAELSTWRFYSSKDQNGVQGKIDLDINCVISHGTYVSAYRSCQH